jgi:glycosyltransferase involved in cell wall biosynthesis
MTEKEKKILFIAPFYFDRSPSQRFRFEQYLNFFESNGFDCRLKSIVKKGEDDTLYLKGAIVAKILLFVKFILRRYKHLRQASKYDIIFVQREACFLGHTFFEKRLAKKSKLIFDFDDAIWLPNVSSANQKLEWLKNYQKTSKIISYSDAIIAGNQYLADYALQYNKNINIIPTTIDTAKFVAKEKLTNGKVCIGWSGSKTTVQHFEFIESVLIKIKEKYKDQVYFKLIGDADYKNENLDLKGIAWTPLTEVSEIQTFDIGIMPLPNDEWAKGKCGLKGLSYMAVGVPTIMSPVGVNTEIIKDKQNGLLASTEEEWLEKLSLLIENADIRETLGKAGRKTVEDTYSVKANSKKYLKIFRSVLAKT